MYSGNQRDFESLIREGYTVRIGEYFSRGWEIFKENFAGFVCFFALTLLLNGMLSLIPKLGTIASMVIGAPLHAGVWLVAFKIAKKKPTTFGDFFRGFNYFTPVFFATLLMIFLTSVGMIFLIIPGLYLAVSYMFTIPLILEKKMDVWSAMEGSRKLITKSWLSMFLFILVLGLLNLGGALLLGIGLLITAPLSTCAVAAAYEDIVGLRLSSNLEED